jgi:VWFA-related protein
LELQRQISAAECDTCIGAPTAQVAENVSPSSAASRTNVSNGLWTLRRTVDEVGLFFAATDSGKAVSDLSASDVQIRDKGKAPAQILGFRNESELPLRLGLVIDTSASITGRIAFERSAASDFLRHVLTGSQDEVFAVSFANSVLLIQDFTRDEAQIGSAIDKLAPAGGTALWDAVTFAANKLADTGRDEPLAKILVVVSDGEDNSSSATLKQAIEAAQHGEVTVYVVSTRSVDENDQIPAGNKALKVLAQQTGGAAFFPGAVGLLNHSLNDLQEVIRSRYLISYKPADFATDGGYRPIEIAVQKGHKKLRVYARKGYFALSGGGAAN